MSVREEIQQLSADLDAPDLLRYLITERFPGETVVTASLKASSIVVLRMVSGIDPNTPIIFCQRPPVFEESNEYRLKIIEQLGLTNTSMNDGHEPNPQPGDVDHTEDMWLSYKDMPGKTYQILHLNDCLAPYKCWISAVYHIPPIESKSQRISVDGRLIKVDPLVHWSQRQVHNCMQEHHLPFHKMAKREFHYDEKKEVDTSPTYPF